MRMKWFLPAAMALGIMIGTSAAAAETEGMPTDEVTEISTVEELMAVNDNLSGNYVLTADLDLGKEEWTPLGSFVQMGQEGEEAETPDAAYAFTGTFDGQGHTIQGLSINQPESWSLGLFGCIANAQVGNFTLTDAQVDGTTMVSAVVGYSFCSKVSDVILDGAVITAHETEMSEEGMYGGIVGAGMMSTIRGCSANAEINIPDNTANAGIVGGGLEMTSVVDSSATGTISAGDNCYGLGGVSGCGFGAEEFSGCSAEDVVINAGDHCFWIGGITGYCGGFDDETLGLPITAVKDCSAANVSITSGAGADGIGKFVGAGFYHEGLVEMMGSEAFANPTEYTITDCTSENVTISEAAGEAVAAAGEEATEAAEAAGEEATEAAEAAEEAIEAAAEIAGEAAEEAVEGETDASAAEASENGIFAAIAGENGTTYENFFDVTLSDENYDLWYDCSAAVVGEEAAESTVAFMQGYISSDLYGEDAIAYYEENPDAPSLFDCFYINGLKLVTFNPDQSVTVELEDGTTETHSYDFLGSYLIVEGETMVYMGQEIDVAFPCDVYQSTDEAGEFNYFFLRDDTMEETGHIEFRYGKDLEELQGYFTGPYAYWLTAGFDKNADAETLKKTVQLFCLENMDYSSHSEGALFQISDLMGTWTADLSEFGDEYKDVQLYFTIDENGHGETMMNDQQTADFEAYAYDNGEAGDGKGIYVAYSYMEGTAEAADYTLETNEDGETVLTFYADDGVISYVKTA